MIKNRLRCLECPWHVKSEHNKKMIDNIERLVSNGSLISKEHKCHMIDHNLWSKPNLSNICIGSINNN